jgi:predicted transcriptional regulator
MFENKARYDERKYEILKVLSRKSPLTSRQILEEIIQYYDVEASLTSVQTCLTRMYKQGLVKRYPIELRSYLYSITKKGLQRIKWIEENIYIQVSR